MAIAYLLVPYFAGVGKSLLQMIGFLALPMACIWYSDELGSLTGNMGRGKITSTTPGCLVAFGGWLLLSMPVIVGLVILPKESGGALAQSFFHSYWGLWFSPS
ncbi:MAG: hypothetical protein WCI03_08405 [bacterium]